MTVAMPTELGRLVVVAAHPDDETLGAAGLLRAAHAAGSAVELVVATDGEAAFPDASAAARADLATTRRKELTAALRALDLDTPVTWLGLPDSALAEHEAALVHALRPHLVAADTCLAPWTGDPHPDHAAAGRAARSAAPAHTHCYGYPIWAEPWGHPLPEEGAHLHLLDQAARAAKAAAIAEFGTQTAPAPDGGPPILPPDVLAHFGSGREVFLREPPERSAPVERFAELYAADPDPWGTRTRWYEERKRAVVLACLPRREYRHAAEPGCGIGVLTAALAERCARVSASDPVSGGAVTALPGVTVTDAALPDPAALPAGVDLVVASEVLYYLAPTVVGQVLDRIAAALDRGGDLVLVHWRGVPAEAPQDAAAVHRRFRADPRFASLVEHRDEDFLLDVLRRR